MKKTLLLITLLSIGISNAQSLINDNYNGLTIGNFTTNVDGSAAGQGGYSAFGGVVGNYNVVAESGRGNVAMITGSNTATGTRYLYKSVSTGWASRTSGNNIIDVEFDIFTGAATTSKNTARVYIYNSDSSTVLGGLILNLETKSISGIAYYDPNNGGVNPIGTYTFNLGASNAVINLTANSWVRIGVSYNTTTRQVIWKGPGFYVGVTGAIPATGTTAPGEIDYLHTAGTGNVLAATSKFDNLSAIALAAEALLGTEDFQSSNFSVYPNPTTDILNINSKLATIQSVVISDINGRTVKSITINQTNTQVNVSDLNAGIYILTINSENGSTVKKFIKN